jgi:hypothetical protein
VLKTLLTREFRPLRSIDVERGAERLRGGPRLALPGRPRAAPSQAVEALRRGAGGITALAWRSPVHDGDRKGVPIVLHHDGRAEPPRGIRSTPRRPPIVTFAWGCAARSSRSCILRRAESRGEGSPSFCVDERGDGVSHARGVASRSSTG